MIVGAHAVMANGGLYASASCHLLAIAAQHHSVRRPPPAAARRRPPPPAARRRPPPDSDAAPAPQVPLVVCAGLYKLAPLFPSGPEQYCPLLSPQPPGEP